MKEGNIAWNWLEALSSWKWKERANKRVYENATLAHSNRRLLGLVVI